MINKTIWDGEARKIVLRKELSSSQWQRKDAIDNTATTSNLIQPISEADIGS